ncbi:MAG: hypothetical protein AAGH99_07920 [Planctomycetota bacterium]
MQSTTWFRLRMVISVFVIGMTMLIPGQPFEDLRSLPTEIHLFVAIFLIASLILIPLMLLFVIGIQAINPLNDSQWLKPTHDANPLYLRNPLFFFHFAAYLIFAAGGSLLVSSLWRGWPALAHGVYLLLAAPMILLGIRICIRVFRHKLPTPGQEVSPLPAPDQDVSITVR